MGIGDKISHKVEQLVGKGKESAGKATGDEQLEAEGRVDQVKGKAKEAGEKVKDAGEKVKDAARDIFKP